MEEKIMTDPGNILAILGKFKIDFCELNVQTSIKSAKNLLTNFKKNLDNDPSFTPNQESAENIVLLLNFLIKGFLKSKVSEEDIEILINFIKEIEEKSLDKEFFIKEGN